jgi:DNA-binding NarL/FixJ family response regulator
MSGMVDPAPNTATTRPVLVGRERERALLLEALEATAGGHGTLVLVSGEAGIGKTTLVEDLARRARERGLLALTGSCYDQTTTAPYGPWLDAFGGYPSTSDLPSVPPVLRGDAEICGAESAAELFRDVRDFLDDASSRIPLVLILEDLHWADQSSLDLLSEVARRLDRTRMLIIATWRVDELNRRHALYRLIPSLVRQAGGIRIDVRPLGTDAQRALIAAQYGLTSDDAARLAVYLRQHGEGNPFFLTELLRTLVEEKLLVRDGSVSWRLGDLSQAPVPELVRQVIETRVIRLGDDVRQLLEIAAVIGHEVPLDLWTALIDVDNRLLLSAVERLVDARLLNEMPPNSYRFSHALVREAIYDGIVLPRRQALHREIGQLLAARTMTDPDLISHHFQQAADPRAATWLLRAGQQARARFAPRVAVERFTSALAMIDGLSATDQIQAHLERGRASETLGDLTAAIADGEVALALARAANDWKLEWQTQLDLGTAWAPSNYERAGECYRQALDLARSSGDPTTLAVSLNRLGNWHFNVMQLREASRLHQEALAILERQGDLANLADTHDCLGMCWWGSGDGDRAAEHWDAAMELFEHLGDRRRFSSSMLSAIALSLVDFMVVAARPEAQGVALSEHGLALAREIGWRPGEVFAQVNVARFLLLRGEISNALAEIRRAMALAESIEHREWSAACWWMIGLTHFNVHDLTEARPAFERALELARQIGSLFWTRMIGSALARTLIDLGELDRAEDVLASLFGSVGDGGGGDGTLLSSHRSWSVASLALAQDDAAQALAVIDANLAALPNIDRGVVPALSMLRGRALVNLDRLAEAVGAFEAARSWLARFNERPARLDACIELGRVYRRLGRLHESREAIDEAGEIATYIADHIADQETRSKFEGYVADRRTEASSAKDGSMSLSPREVEVLRLVAEGLTDVQVADRLFLSRRTVSSHLRSIYQKLGVSTRTAAARLAIDQQLI